MKKLASLSLAALFSISLHSHGADTPVPPPPPEGKAGATPPAAGKFAGGGEPRHPLMGLVKRVEEKGSVSKEEFLENARKQAEEIFSRLDANGDGVIDKSEVAKLEQMKGAMREKIQEKKGSGLRQRPESKS